MRGSAFFDILAGLQALCVLFTSLPGGLAMFQITLLAMGKLKEKFYLSAAAEYEKRLSGTCRFQLLELPECRLPESPQPSEIAAGLAREAELIRQKIPGAESPGRPLPLHGENDLSPSPGADYGSGTALPGRVHSGRKQISQIALCPKSGRPVGRILAIWNISSKFLLNLKHIP